MKRTCNLPQKHKTKHECIYKFATIYDLNMSCLFPFELCTFLNENKHLKHYGRQIKK